jgi:SNF2 family DNA or RNA helicase
MKYRTEGLLALPLGFGKTIVALTSILEIRRIHPTWRVLVVSTSAIIRHTWGDEIRDWSHTQGLSYGDASSFRLPVIESKPDILGINFESLIKFLDLIDKRPDLCPEILVIDESSKMKAPNAHRVQRMAGLRRITRKDGVKHYKNFPGYHDSFKRRFLLSGTPRPEGYDDLWAQSCLLSKRRRLGENITSFRKQYCMSDYNGFGYTVVPALESVIEEKLKYVMYLPNKADYLDLPDPIHRAIDVPWDPESWERYKTLEDEYVAVLEDLDPAMSLESVEIEAPNAGVLRSKLRQLCSGFLYDTDHNTHWLDPEAKGNALLRVLDRCADTPLLVFTQFIAEQDYLREEFGFECGIPDELERWNHGGIPRLALHPRSAAHGLNLQGGSHICLYYSLPDSYEEWAQSWGRLHRRGQTRQVSALRLQRTHSVELDVWSNVQGKNRDLEAFLLSMRRRRELAGLV